MINKEEKLIEKFHYVHLVDISDYGFPFRFPFGYAGLNPDKSIDLISNNLMPLYTLNENVLRKILKLFLKAYEERSVQEVKKDKKTEVGLSEGALNLDIDAITQK